MTSCHRPTRYRPLSIASALLAACLAGPPTSAAPNSSAPPASPPPASAPATPAAAGEFPDAWYFYGERRPDVLRRLEGQPAPTLRLKDWVGDAKDVNALRGTLANGAIDGLRGKVVVVDFWGTWCPPCRKAIPKNIEMVKKLGDEGLVFIGVHDSSRGAERMPDMVRAMQVNYPVAVDDGGVSTKAWKVPFWPTYAVVDRRGIVRAAGLDPGRVETVVQKLLAEAPPAAPKQPAADVALGAMADAPAPQETRPAAPGKPGKPKADRPFQRDTEERPPPGEFPHSYYFGSHRRAAALMEMEGKPAPKLRLTNWLGADADVERMTRLMKGDQLDLAKFKGNVVTVLFWSTVSEPCMRSMNKNQNLVKDYASRGLVFLAVHDTEIGVDMREPAVAAHQCNFPNGLDVSNASKTAWHVEVYPTYAVIDHTGVVRAIGLRTSKVMEVVDKLIREKEEAQKKLAEQPFGVAPRPE